MICECRWRPKVAVCPDCGGTGIAHCCEGLRADDAEEGACSPGFILSALVADSPDAVAESLPHD